MLRELGPKIIFHYNGDGGGNAREGSMIFPSPHDLGGVHFHSEKPLTLDQATELLRKRHWISPNETAVSLANWGKNKKGVEGYAAVTDAMAKRIPL